MTDYELVMQWIRDTAEDPDYSAEEAFRAVANYVDANR